MASKRENCPMCNRPVRPKGKLCEGCKKKLDEQSPTQDGVTVEDVFADCDGDLADYAEFTDEDIGDK
jgi:hypothetical protein